MSDKTPFGAWNISSNERKMSASENFQSSRNQLPSFPIRSFSEFGGGDAPLLANIPKVRNQLFTISTRSVMSSHSQLNVSYTTTTPADLDEEKLLLPLTKTHSDGYNLNARDEDADEKLINIPQVPLLKAKVIAKREAELDLESLGAVGGSGEFNCSFLKAAEKSVTPPMVKRCFHGSLEDLRDGVGEPTSDLGSNRRKSAPPVIPSSSARCQMIAAKNDLLNEENKSLSTRIQKTRKKLFITKIATCFALEALKRRGRIIKQMEVAIEKKNEQCAARLILHSLLLNCWRNTRRELDMKLDDNNELRKSVENFTLQVQVLRHVSNNERQKSQEKTKLIDNLSDEVRILKEENRIMRREVEKMENELNSLQASTQNLTDENNLLSKEIKIIIERRDELNQAFERERKRSEEFGKENVTMKESLRKVEKQLKDTSEQKTNWQERAMTFESEVWEHQLNLKERNKSINELKASCDALQKERTDLIEKKTQLETNLDKTATALQNLIEKNDELTKTYEALRAERDAKAKKIGELETTLDATKKEFVEIEKELLAFKLQNVRRRREWGNALYFIVSPVDAVRRKLTYT